MDGDAWMQGCMDAWMHEDAYSDQGNDNNKKSAATKTTKSIFERVGYDWEGLGRVFPPEFTTTKC